METNITMAQIVIALLGSQGFFTLILWFLNKREQEKRETLNPYELKCFVECTRAMVQDRIVHLSNMYIKKGMISIEDKNDLREIYEPYRKGGGNHRAELHWNEVCRLPVVDEYPDHTTKLLI